MAATAAELGADGRFLIQRDAMGVPGLHVAVNVFSKARPPPALLRAGRCHSADTPFLSVLK